MNISQIHRAKSLLSQAMGAASGTSNSTVLEAKRHMQQAFSKLEHVEEKHQNKSVAKETQFQKWWGHIQGGLAACPKNVTAQQRTLAQLNAMIEAEQKKIDSLDLIPDIVEELLSE